MDTEAELCRLRLRKRLRGVSPVLSDYTMLHGCHVEALLIAIYLPEGKDVYIHI
jgi:hypothetical protein